VGDGVYIIVKSDVEVVREESGKGEIVIAKQGPGECIGEIALISKAPRTATVRTFTRVDAVTIERGAFTALLVHVAPLRKIFEQVMQERVERSKERSGATE